MADSKQPAGGRLIQCDICLKEIPESEARIAEAQDYVMHFCGLDCYQKWSKKQIQAGDEPEETGIN